MKFLVAVNAHMILTVAVLAVLVVLSMPTPVGWRANLRALIGRPFLALVAAIGIWFLITTVSAVMSIPAQATPTAPAEKPNHHRSV